MVIYFIPSSINRIGSAAADTLARAIVHAMLSAKSVDDCIISYCDAYPEACRDKDDDNDDEDERKKQKRKKRPRDDD